MTHSLFRWPACPGVCAGRRASLAWTAADEYRTGRRAHAAHRGDSRCRSTGRYPDAGAAYHRHRFAGERKHPRFRCRGFRILASDRRGECGVPETHCNGGGNQRRPDLRVRPDLFLPRIRGRGAAPGRPDRAAARGRHSHIGRAPHSRLHCPFRSHRLSGHGATGSSCSAQCPGSGRHRGRPSPC